MEIGIDLGGMSAKAALLDEGRLLGKTSVVTSRENSPDETARQLAGLCRSVVEAAGIDERDVTTVGIGAPGVVNGKEGVIVKWSNFGWDHVPLAALVQEYTKKSVFVVNDANAATLGEAKYGAGKEFRDVVMITIGTGVGGGVMIDGKLFEGFCGAGAELGHTVIRLGGRLCACGRRGCLERYVSARALIEDTKAAMHKYPESILWKIAPTFREVDGKTVFRAVERGDRAAEAVFSEYVSRLGDGIANFVNIFRPQAVVIGGGISAEGERLLAPLRESVLPRIYVSAEYAPLQIVCAALGNDAGIYGAAEYAREQLKN